MRILITGYTGLIGSNLYMHLKEKGMDVSNVNSDQLEFVYNVVINNKNPEPLSDERKYKKVKWNGDRQIEKFLNIILKLLFECKKDGRTKIKTPIIYIRGTILLIIIFNYYPFLLVH